MKVTKAEILEFKKLNSLVKSGKAKPEEIERAKELAMKIKGKSRNSRQHEEPGTNDIAWYNKYPELLKDAANVIFNEVAGTKFNAPVKSSTNNISYLTVGARFNILPTIGKCFEANHPFNYQMRDLWLKLHRAYRGVGTYEYADLGIVIYAIMQTFADIARAERIYGLCSRFVARNRSYPSVVVTALGLDPSAVSASELADFRYQINRCIAKAAILCLPKGFSAFELYIRLMGNIFIDSEDVRAQWFLYDNAKKLEYDPTFTTGSSITYKSRTATGTGGTQTFVDIIQDINDQLDNLLSDTDVARICSDILKAFGESGVQTLIPVPEDFTIEPIVDDVRKSQLHNTTIVGRCIGGGFSSAIFTALGSFSTSDETLRIYQENGVVKQRLFVRAPYGGGTSTPALYSADGAGNYYPTGAGFYDFFNYGDAKLDSWKGSPTGDDVIEMSRQTVVHSLYTFTSGGTTIKSIELDSYPIYVVDEMTLYTADPTGYVQTVNYRSNYMPFNSLSTALMMIAIVSNLSRLDWAPSIHLIDNSSGSITSEYEFWDCDNYSLVSKEALSRMHDACVLSLFKLEVQPNKE